MRKSRIRYMSIAMVASAAITSSGLAEALPAACGAANIATTDGGQRLKRPQVTVIFWGKCWPNNCGLFGGQIIGALEDMFNGPYFSGLNEYNMMGLPRLLDNVVFKTDTDPPNPFATVGDIGNMVKGLLSTRVPAASPDIDNAYVVILPPQDSKKTPCASKGVNDDWGGCNKNNNANGCHAYISDSVGTTFNYAWVTNSNSLVGQGSVPMILGHEVAEMITDPAGNGLQYKAGGEIGDGTCNGCTTTIGKNWYSVQPYYSVANGRCIVPMAYPAVFSYDSSNHWQQLYSGPVKQIAAGGFGLFATDFADMNDNGNGVNGSNLWQILPSLKKIGAAGSNPSFARSFAVTDNTVWALDTFGVTLSRYTGSGTTWDTFDTAADGTFHALTGGGTDTAVAMAGVNNGLWYYNPSDPGTSITKIDGATIQHAVNRYGVFEVSMNHDFIYQFDTNDQWNTIDTAGDDWLISGEWMPSVIGSGANHIWNWDGANGVLYSNGPSHWQYAIAGLVGTPLLYAIDAPTNTSFYQSNNPYQNSASWSLVPQSGIARLIGGGDKLYGVGLPCPVQTTKPSPVSQTCF